ncbi:hypothetical protein YC2023_043505 [Brassica napus]
MRRGQLPQKYVTLCSLVGSRPYSAPTKPQFNPHQLPLFAHFTFFFPHERWFGFRPGHGHMLDSSSWRHICTGPITFFAFSKLRLGPF